MTSKKQLKEQSSTRKNKIVSISSFEIFEFKQLREQLIRKYGAVLFLPLYDRGEMRGYVVICKVRNSRKDEKISVDEKIIRNVCLANTVRGQKMWLEIQKWGTAAVKI